MAAGRAADPAVAAHDVVEKLDALARSWNADTDRAAAPTTRPAADDPGRTGGGRARPPADPEDDGHWPIAGRVAGGRARIGFGVAGGVLLLVGVVLLVVPDPELLLALLGYGDRRVRSA